MFRFFEYSSVRQVLISGDIHGNFKGIVHKLCVQYGCTDTLLIVAGDCGFGFEKLGYYQTVYNQVAGRLRKANNYVVFVRGNHDDPSYFREEKVHYERWRCVPDYSVVRACGHDILCVGGAVSIDRFGRKEENARLRQRGHLQTASWWLDEVPVFLPEEIGSLSEDVRIDTVVSHTAPSCCDPLPCNKGGLSSWAVYDPALLWDTEVERITMDDIMEAVRRKHPVERWYYGHFHRSWTSERDGILFRMLDIEEFNEIPENNDGHP